MSADEIEIRNRLDKVLDSYRRGLRDLGPTVENLRKLFDASPSDCHEKFFDHLLWLLADELRRRTRTDSAENKSCSRVIMRAIAEFGPADRMFPQLFGYLESSTPAVVQRWGHDVFPEMAGAVHHQPNRLSQAALNVMKAHAEMYSKLPDTGALAVELARGAQILVRAIDDLEFRRFEDALARAAPAAAQKQPTGQVEELEPYLASLGMSPSIARAMHEARACLNSGGEFDPKKAADLIRSSMDEMHRGVVSDLVKLTAQPFAEKDSDGGRRRYMRVAGFITEAEENFFSAVYGLISQEGSHKLEAPRETILVLERTVSDYLLLLARRLSRFGKNPL